MLGLVLTVFAFVLFCCAAWGVPAGRWSLGWAGLACYMAALLFGNVAALVR